MFLITKPGDDEILRFLAREEESQLSYQPVGISAGPSPGFKYDVERACIGHGEEVFLSGCTALRSWRMFDLGWVSIYPRDAGTVVGTDVAVLIRHLGFWSLNGCRVVPCPRPAADWPLRSALVEKSGPLASVREVGV